MVPSPCDIEGGRSNGWWGLTLGEGGDGEGGGRGEGLHEPADISGGGATDHYQPEIWGQEVGWKLGYGYWR